MRPLLPVSFTTFRVVSLSGLAMLLYSAQAGAQTTPAVGAPDEALVLRGLQIAPVPLNMAGKSRAMVGYGSYLVNALGGCNDCHTNPSYAPGGDPFTGAAKKVNTAGYLAGGVAFGPFTSRNITPDATGEVAGGLANFKQIIKTGIDLDKRHPQISPLLQVMPWPVYQDAADRDLEAIYAYLTSIPCLQGGPEERANRCSTVRTTAVASPKNLTVVAREVQLDGTQSTSADGKALKYMWTIAAGSPGAAIIRGDTATPSVQLVGRNVYTFQLTVTDSSGGTATDLATVNYAGR